MPSILKIFDNEGVEIPIPAIQGPAGPAGPNSISTSTDSSITGLLKGADGKVAQALPGTDYATPEDLHAHDNKSALDSVSGTNTGDQAASGVAYTPSTYVASTDIQNAITEVGNEIGDAAAVLAAINGDGVIVPTETLIANHNTASTAHTILARKSETMRLLISRTIGAGENVSAITWTHDDAGNALALIDAEIRIYVPSNSLANGSDAYFSARISGISSGYYSTYTGTPSSSFYLGRVRNAFSQLVSNVKKIGNSHSLNTASFASDAISTPVSAIIYQGVAGVDTINKIYIYILSGLTYFPTSTVFEIYGRTA